MCVSVSVWFKQVDMRTLDVHLAERIPCRRHKRGEICLQNPFAGILPITTAPNCSTLYSQAG